MCNLCHCFDILNKIMKLVQLAKARTTNFPLIDGMLSNINHCSMVVEEGYLLLPSLVLLIILMSITKRWMFLGGFSKTMITFIDNNIMCSKTMDI